MNTGNLKYPAYFFTGVGYDILTNDYIGTQASGAAYKSRLCLDEYTNIRITNTKAEDGSVYYSCIYSDKNKYWVGWTHCFSDRDERPITVDTALILNENIEEYSEHRYDIINGDKEIELHRQQILSSTCYVMRDFVLVTHLVKLLPHDKLITVWVKLTYDNMEVIDTPEQYRDKLFVEYMDIVNHFYSEDDQDWVASYLVSPENFSPERATLLETYEAYIGKDTEIDVDMIIMSTHDIDNNTLAMVSPQNGKIKAYNKLEEGCYRHHLIMFGSSFVSGLYYYQQYHTGGHPTIAPTLGFIGCLSAHGHYFVRETTNDKIVLTFAETDVANYIVENNTDMDSAPGETANNYKTVVSSGFPLDNKTDIAIYHHNDIIIVDRIVHHGVDNFHHILSFIRRKHGISNSQQIDDLINQNERHNRFIPYEIMLDYVNSDNLFNKQTNSNGE